MLSVLETAHLNSHHNGRLVFRLGIPLGVFFLQVFSSSLEPLRHFLSGVRLHTSRPPKTPHKRNPLLVVYLYPHTTHHILSQIQVGTLDSKVWAVIRAMALGRVNTNNMLQRRPSLTMSPNICGLCLRSNETCTHLVTVLNIIISWAKKIIPYFSYWITT